MGGIILRALLDQGLLAPERTSATVVEADLERARAAHPGVGIGADNRQAVSQAEVVLMCVKPNQIQQVLKDIQPAVQPGQVFLSIVTATSTEAIEAALGKVAVVRIMPNTPALVREGMMAICKGKYATDEQVEMTRTLFSAIGRTVVVEEKHMDAITGLSGSGPAYIFVILDALADAGVKLGLPRQVALLLAAQTTRGAATLVLESGAHPAVLKDEVTTPAGTTIAGLVELEEGKLRATLIKAVSAAARRARELKTS